LEAQNNVKADLGNLTIRDIFFKYVRFIPIFLISIAIALLGAYLYLRYSTPIYRATGAITFISENSKDRFDQIFKANATDDIDAEIEVLRSASLMERVILKANLYTNYFAIGKIKTLNIYKSCPFRLEILQIADSSRFFSMNVNFLNQQEFRINNEKQVYKAGQLFENAYGIFRILINKNAGLGNEYSVTWTPAAALAPVYAGMVRVGPKAVRSMIHYISMDLPNLELGMDIINTLIDEYQKVNIEYRNTMTTQTLNFINVRLALLERDLDSVERRLLRFKQSNNIFDMDVQSKTYFDIISEADKSVNTERMNLKIVELIEEYLRDKNTKYEKVPSSLGINNEVFQALIAEYNKKVTERRVMLEGGTKPQNVIVRNLEAEIEEIRLDIFEALKNSKRLYETIINDVILKKGTARIELNYLPQKAKDLIEIEREKDIKQKLYSFLLEKREETAMSKASTIPNSKVLSYAVGNPIPIKPNRRGIQILAIIVGLGVPSMFIFFLEIINDKITTRFDIEKITDAAILGEVGHSYNSSSLVVSSTNRSMVAEQFRIIRSNMQYVLNKIERPTILVTSSFSGEGKSFITTNLAGVMALAGRKTVVLEFDIRKPQIINGLKLKAPIGITNFLLGKAKPEELPIKVPGFNNLYAIGCGPVPPNPSELLLDSKIAELFDWAKQNFEVVIIDTAPVGMVSDAMTLGAFADATLYIVRQGHTYKKQVALIDEFYRENKLPRISIIVNDVKLRPGYGYYGYGRYGYGYGYSGGYYEEENHKGGFKKIFQLSWLKNIFKKDKQL
jgi:tyrosine-protein kinase Etk/Wzc